MRKRDQGDLPNYWGSGQPSRLWAKTFWSLHGGSFPNHMYTIAADNFEATSNPANPGHPKFGYWGCDAPAGSPVTLEVFPDGVVRVTVLPAGPSHPQHPNFGCPGVAGLPPPSQ